MGAWVLFDGEVIPRSRAAIPVDDLAVQHGWGLFETTRAYGGVAFQLEEHLARLHRSGRRLEVRVPALRPARLHSQIGVLLRKEGLRDGVAVRITVTRGSEREGPHWFVQTRPVKLPGPRARLVVVPWERSVAHPLSGHKTLNYLENALAREFASRRGASEALFVSTGGHVLEGTASNLFLIRKGALVTPDLGERILPGITRGLVIRLARRLGLRVSETVVRPRDLFTAEQVFVTSSLIEILAVSHVEGRPTRQRGLDLIASLQQAYRRRVAEYVEEFST
jgi:branched-subunit amino acid aminotransferase/4-amino-4-deoxychorismate lyase